MAITLTGANQQTEWWDLTGVSSDVCFNLTGDFNAAVGIRYSNVDDYDKGTNYRNGATTWSAATGPRQLPFGIARYVAFYSGGSWGSGTTCTPTFARAKDANGHLVNIAPQEGN